MKQLDRKHILVHHGIAGQKWGKRNGPPYPLKPEDHSAAEKKASKGEKSKGLKLTENQKKAILIGSAACAVALATYGAYKVGAFNKNTKLPSGDFSIPITGEEALEFVNPHRGEEEYKNDCAQCAVAGFMSTIGPPYHKYEAAPSNGKPSTLSMVASECFSLSDKDIKIGVARTFGKSQEDASQFVIKKFGQNAKGAVSIRWNNEYAKYFSSERSRHASSLDIGHIFNFEIVDGNVKWYDYSTGKSEIKNYWKYIDNDGPLEVVNFSNAKQFNWDNIDKYAKCIK